MESLLRRVVEFGRRWWKLTAVLLVVHVALHRLFRHKPPERPMPISHQGAAGVSPENTLASIQKALDLGVIYIEVDVQRTRDNVLVLLHDKTINRTTSGRGAVRELDWSVVAAANRDFPVPALEAVFELIRPTKAVLVLELKHPRLYPGIERQVLALIGTYGLEKRVIVVSFDLDSLERVKQIRPEIETGQLYIHGFFMPRVKDTSLVEVFWLMPLVDPTFVWRQHRAGRRVWVWTVNNPLLMRLLLWLGVDGITTDFPERWPH